MGTIEGEVSKLFQESGIEKQVLITTNEHMYTIKDCIEDNWLFYTFFGFKELQNRLILEGKIPKKIAIIGTGNGVDALGTCSIINGIEELLITDIDPRVIPLSVKNVESNISNERYKPRINSFVGNLCNPLLEKSLKVDLVYANLPNLPSDSENIADGYNLSSLYRREKDNLDTSKDIRDYLLEMQQLFLHSAKGILNSNGSVLSIIGGRVPHELFFRIFTEEGLKLEELCSGFKRQTEPDVIISEYANAERGGIKFSFYHYTKAKEHLKKLDITNPTTKINGIELSNALKDYRISAGEALNLYRDGIDIGHTVHVFRGILSK
jgi:hypothetical protein